jgi:hypothetical protein
LGKAFQAAALIPVLALLFGLSAPARGELVISELMYHTYEPWPASQPTKTTNNSEYVEIYNAGTTTAVLTEYRFDSGITFDFPAGSTLATGAYLVVCGNRVGFTNWYPAVSNYVGEFSGSLNNGGERVTLSRLVGGTWVTADTIKYYGFGRSDGEGPSLELVNPGLARLDDQFTGDWAASTSTNGTPGRTNSVYAFSLPPVVGDVQHNPPLPPAGSSVTITARVAGRDNDLMTAVRVLYRENSGAWTNTPMNDAGTDGDAVASNGIYTVVLPPYGRPTYTNGAVIEFQIAATNTLGSRTFPITNTADNAPGPYSYFFCVGEDTDFNGEYVTYHIVLSEANKASLWSQGNELIVYPAIDGTLITSDGEIYYNCAFLQRGSTRLFPYGYAVELPAGRTLAGYQKIDFNFQRHFNNYLGMKITAAAGVPASRVKLMRLWMNESLLQPVDVGQRMYLRVERPIDVMKRMYPDDDGNLYKVDAGAYHGTLTTLSPLSAYQSQYGCNTGNPYTVWQDLSNLTWAINLPPSSNLASVITNYVKDPRAWAGLFAVNTALNNSEMGFLAPAAFSADELRIYGDRKGQFTWMPWDYSDVLLVGDGGTPSTAWNYAGSATERNFLFNPPMISFYAGVLLDVLNNIMAPTNMNAMIDELGTAATSLGTDWRYTYTNNVRILRDILLADIKTNFTITVNGAAVTSDFVVVSVTNQPETTVVTTNQTPTNVWIDLGWHLFSGFSNEYVTLTRNVTTSGLTTAHSMQLSNSLTSFAIGTSNLKYTNSAGWTPSGASRYTSTKGAFASWNVTPATAGVYKVYAFNVMTNADTNAEYRIIPMRARLSLHLTGTASQGYTTRVLVNGSDCTWATSNATWSTTNDLISTNAALPVTVQALDAEGNVLQSRSFTVVAERTPVSKTGTISTNTEWSGVKGSLSVTGDVTIASNVTLSVASNTTVVFEPGGRLIVNGTLDVRGTSAYPVLFSARNIDSPWSIEASGASGAVTVAYARMVGGRITAAAGAAVTLQDCSLEAYAGTNGIINCNSAGTTYLLRCAVTNYGTTIFQGTPTTIEDCLFRGIGVRGIDLRGPTTSATVQRSTVEISSAAGVDGIRFTGCTVGLVSNCMVDTLSGTGLVVSSSAPIIDGALMYDVYAGVAGATSSLRRSTITGSTVGLRNVSAAPQDCIIWDNVASTNGGPATASYCDIGLAGTNLYPGAANLNRTPFFRDTPEHDFRLLTNSPCLTSGSGAGSMGAVFPAGATPAAPDGLNISGVSTSSASLNWTNRSTSEQWIEVQASADGTAWWSATNVPANTTNCTVTGLVSGSPYVFRVRAAHARGASLFSDEVATNTVVGTTLQRLRDGLRITELMYNPPDPTSGPYVSENFEFIELQNIGGFSLDLSGLYFSTGVSFVFTNGTTLSAGTNMLLVQNSDAFTSRYHVPYHGVYTGKLDDGGETLRIKDALANTVLEITYDDSSDVRWYPSTDGGGYSLVLASTNSDPSKPESWRASTATNGSPGVADPPPSYGTIVINEVLSHQDKDNPGDWIELYNAGTGNVDISYWFLSDNGTVLTNFQIAGGQPLMAPGSYRRFTEFSNFGTNVLGANGFGLSELGDSVYLSSADSSNHLTGFRTFVAFGAAENSVTFGRHKRSDDVYDFTAMSSTTPTNANAYPKVGPVVINEINYNPFAGGKEFVEIMNITGSSVPLFDSAHPANAWHFDGAMEYVFPPYTWLKAGEIALVVSVDPAEFRATSGVTNLSVQIFGPFNGALANSGETVKLYKPNPPELDGFVPYVLADRVQYSDASPWPVLADNGGASLERVSPSAYGNDPTNWVASTLGGTPGALNNTNRMPYISFRVPNGSGYETNTTVPVEISLYPSSATTVTVQCAVLSGTATRNDDYTFTDGTLVFWPYETAKIVSLAILDDSNTNGEPDETVVIGLSALSSNAALGGTRQFAYTIVDTDATNLPPPTISPAGTNYFTNSVSVTMSNSTPFSVIRYTVDGSRPTDQSTLYERPFAQTFGARITARTFLGSFDSGGTTNALFIARTPPLGWSEQSFFLKTLAYGFGTISGGNRYFTAGSSATAVATPDAFSQFSGWTGDTNGAPSTSTNVFTVLIDSNREVWGHFDEKYAISGTPLRWLGSYYSTNDYNNAELDDVDRDGMVAGEEYIADTDPTDSNSVLRVVQAARGTSTLDLYWSSRTSRWYSVERTTNFMLQGWPTQLLTHVQGDASGIGHFTDTAPPPREAYYRITVTNH